MLRTRVGLLLFLLAPAVMAEQAAPTEQPSATPEPETTPVEPAQTAPEQEPPAAEEENMAVAAEPTPATPATPVAPAASARSKPAGKPAAASPPRLAVAVRAARPWSFPATVSPVLFGSALAFQVEDSFGPLKLLLTLGTTLGVHAAGNLMNTLFDFRNGFDGEGSSDQTLVTGALNESQVVQLIWASYGLSALCLAPLSLLSKAPALHLSLAAALGAASAFVYTGGPGLKYKALGDVLITSTFGPLLVGFAYMTQAGAIPGLRLLLPALALSAPIEAILHANNARDVDEDARNGVVTLAQMLGPRHSFGFYAALMATPLVYAAVQACTRSALGGLPLLAAPLAAELVGQFKRGEMVGLPKRTAKFQVALGALMVAAALIPSPPLSSLARWAMGAA